ncbi:MAG: hypothetical protein DCC67_08370 [Planctomycetota bacterium]|nr:MAG: hypothetical protein DCC67_08370 [Planctomycetota bacterium]
MNRVRSFFAFVLVLPSLALRVQAAAPFAEDFNAGTANWRFSNSIELDPVPVGGPDGSGYVSRTFAFASLSNPAADAATIFRAQDEYNSSGVAYAGNWITEGVKRVSAFVRHTAPEPLSFTVRLANPANFPGASYLSTAPVPPGVWTKIAFNVTPSSPQNLTYEATSYNTVFSNVGHMQFGVSIPESLRGGATPYAFDLDRVRVSNVPEPAACGLAALALASLSAFIRNTR